MTTYASIVNSIKEDIETCIFRPLRPKNSEKCSNPATTCGFCDKHILSYQGQNALKKLDNKKIDEPRLKLVQLHREDDNFKCPANFEKMLRDKRQANINAMFNTKPTIKHKTIQKNKWGWFEDKETNIVFNKNTKFAYGVQESSGNISELTSKHIKICKKNGWKYSIKPKYEEDFNGDIYDTYIKDNAKYDYFKNEEDEPSDNDKEDENEMDDSYYEGTEYSDVDYESDEY